MQYQEQRDIINENHLNDFFKGKKILITGNTGFKGSWLSELLITLGAEIVGLGLKPATKPNLFTELALDKRMKTYFCDIRDYDEVKRIIEIERPEIVFHLAAQPLVRDSYDDPLYTYQTNVMGTGNVLQAIMETQYTKVGVMVTTDKVYKNKEVIWPYKEIDELGGYDPYSSSKACAELVISTYQNMIKDKNLKTNIVSVRAGNVIAGGDWSKDRLITDIIVNVFDKNQEIIIRSPEAIRPWQHVLDALTGYLRVCERSYEDDSLVGSWNFAPNEENFITVKELIERALDHLGKGYFIIQPDKQKHEAKILKLDSTKAKNYLNWKPKLSIDKTLEWTFQWYKEFYKRKNIQELTRRQIKEYMEK